MTKRNLQILLIAGALATTGSLAYAAATPKLSKIDEKVVKDEDAQSGHFTPLLLQACKAKEVSAQCTVAFGGKDLKGHCTTGAYSNEIGCKVDRSEFTRVKRPGSAASGSMATDERPSKLKGQASH